MITYSRYGAGGGVDTGRILQTDESQLCPACEHKGIISTVSTEQCEECGHIVFDYWRGRTKPNPTQEKRKNEQ